MVHKTLRFNALCQSQKYHNGLEESYLQALPKVEGKENQMKNNDGHKAREFWISRSEYGDTYVFEHKVDSCIHVREVLPGRSDSERLDFLLKYQRKVERSSEGYFIQQWGYGLCGDYKKENKYFKTPREAIDAGIDAEMDQEGVE